MFQLWLSLVFAAFTGIRLSLSRLCQIIHGISLKPSFLDSKDLFFSTQGSLQRLLFLSSSSILSNFWQIVIPLISLYYRPQPYFIPFYVVHFDRYGGLGWFRFLIEMVRIAPNVCPLHLYRWHGLYNHCPWKSWSNRYKSEIQVCIFLRHDYHIVFF